MCQGNTFQLHAYLPSLEYWLILADSVLFTKKGFSRRLVEVMATYGNSAKASGVWGFFSRLCRMPETLIRKLGDLENAGLTTNGCIKYGREVQIVAKVGTHL